MESDFLEACTSIAQSLQPFYPLVRATSVLAGFAIMGLALASLRRTGEYRHRAALPQLAAFLTGALLASFTSVVDALTMSVFAESAPSDMASVSVGSVGGLEPMIRLAVTIVMLVGAYQVVKGLVLLKEAALGARTFWPATTHILGGVLCLNIKTFMLALGSTVGGTLESTVRALLGS